jgi:hypothetical protein
MSSTEIFQVKLKIPLEKKKRAFFYYDCCYRRLEREEGCVDKQTNGTAAGILFK